VAHDTKRIRIRQSRNETNLFGVRIRDYNTKRIHVFTNLLYESRILKKNTIKIIRTLEKAYRYESQVIYFILQYNIEPF
jgi:hypothetical protein